jgi:nitrate/nitrite-specific signal transduction histidine kinase
MLEPSLASQGSEQELVRLFSSLHIHGLRFRLLILVFLALGPAFALVLYTASEQRQVAATHVQENALQLARTAARDQDDIVESTRHLLVLLSQEPALRNPDPAVCSTYLASVLGHYPLFTTIEVVKPDGSDYCKARPTAEPTERYQDPFILGIVATKDFAVGDFRIGRTTRKNTVPLGYPLLDNAGQIQGIIFASLDLAWFNQLAAEMSLPPGSTVMANDRNGTILARYPDPENWVGRSVSDAPIVKTILSQLKEGTAQALGEDGTLRLYAFTPLNGAPNDTVFVSVGVPTTVAFSEVDQILINNLIALGLVSALTLACAWFGADWFLLRQVRALLNLTSRVANGDLGARLGSHAGVGELDQLARAFDSMGESLHLQQEARKHSEEQTQRWNSELEGLMNAVSEAISQSLQVSKIADIVLTRTLSLMDLTVGGVFLRQGDALALVTDRCLPGEVARWIQHNRIGDQATVEMESLPRPEAVGSVSTPTSKPALPVGEAALRWISVPIQAKGQVFGVMCLPCHPSRPFMAHEKGVLAAVGQQMGVAIDNADLSEQLQSVAASRERERLSHELHDGLAQVLGYLCHRTEVAKDLVLSGEGGRAVIQLQEMQGAVEEAHQDLREAVLGLRATVSPRGGMVAALREYAHKFSRQTGIRVSLVAEDDAQPRCSPEAEVQVLRIIQESLANVRKHSGAKQAWIRFEFQEESVVVTIEDDGSGFDSTAPTQAGPEHFGLLTMRERAEGVGGSFQVWSEAGHGTRVQVTLPNQRGGQ